MSTLPFRYRDDIDGLRALAVLPVLLFHANLPWFSGGFVGVDIFFVISGFLITSLVYRDIQDGHFSVADFYERRIRRIFPALFAMLAVTLPFAVWLLLPEDLVGYGKSLIATALSVSNMFFWSESGYFDGPAQLKPLLHTWSLAVEEQFYIFFPLLLWIAFKFLRKNWLLALFVLGTGLSLALSIWGVANKPEATFYLLPTRAWELMMGAVIALGLPLVRHRFVNELMALLGMAMILWCIFTYTHTTPFPGLAALWPCLGAALIIYSGQDQRTFVGRILALKPNVFVGKISYSLYLWHWPLLVLAGYYSVRALTAWESLGMLVLAFVLAVISYYFVESPFRGKGAWGSRKQVYVAGLASILVACGVGAGLVVAKGLPQRLDAQASDILNVVTREPMTEMCHQVYEKKIDPLCIRGEVTEKPSFIVIGDSHGGALAPALFAAASLEKRAGWQFTESGYVASLGYIKFGEPVKYRFMHGLLETMLKEKPEIRDVVMVNYWKQSLIDNTYFAPDGSGKVSGETAVEAAFGRLFQMYPNTTFWLLEDNPYASVYGLNPLARMRQFGREGLDALPRAEAERQREAYLPMFERLKAAYPNVKTLGLYDALCTAQECPGVVDGVPLYRDDNHLSWKGSMTLVPTLRAVFAGGGGL